MSGFTYARCTFWLREPGKRGGFRYTALDLNAPSSGQLRTVVPPQIGDLVELAEAGLFRVVDRQWSYPAYGSAYWPHGKDPAGVGLYLMVERAEGMFVDEEPDDEADE